VGKGRLEAFSDGVIAIIITIMVLELRVPHEPTLDALRPLLPKLISYVLSFIFVGTYWNNHHHLLHAIKHVDGAILWTNLHLLFWLSLVPFVTGWMGENSFAPPTVALYGAVLLMCAIAYTLLTIALIRRHGRDSALASAIGSDMKGKLSLAAYLIAVPLALVNQWIAFALFIFVLVIWFLPDRRIEKEFRQ
jgi:uncharacterized membrane protein